MGYNLKILLCLFLILEGADVIKGETCYSSSTCTDSPDIYCCINDYSYKCCSYSEYFDIDDTLTNADQFVNGSIESGFQLATGIIIAIVVVCILAVIGCIVGCVCCCRHANAQPGRQTVLTTTTIQSGQPVVHHAAQAGSYPGPTKMQYPAGPAPPYVAPGQQFAQPGMPPPYNTQAGYPPPQSGPAGYHPMPSLPAGQQSTTPYPPQPMVPYPNQSQPAYAPGYAMQSQPPYPTKDGSQASVPSAF